VPYSYLDREDLSSPPGLRETEIRIREQLCDEEVPGIDLDVHARHIAVAVVGMLRAHRCERNADQVASNHAFLDDLCDRLPVERGRGEEAWRRAVRERFDA
jgi:hypothetical protein